MEKILTKLLFAGVIISLLYVSSVEAKKEEVTIKDEVNATQEIHIIRESDKEDRVYILAKAIESFEGFYAGSVSQRNNNPGNLRYSPMQSGKKDGFAYFDTYDKGLEALMYQIALAAEGKSRSYRSDMTLLEFFNTYAPSSDNNQPSVYYNFIIKETGFDRTMKLSQLI